MRLREVVEGLHLSVRRGEDQLDQDVTGGFAGDLLSDVIAHSKAGDVWVTMQVHVNIVAVAVLKPSAGTATSESAASAAERVCQGRCSMFMSKNNPKPT